VLASAAAQQTSLITLITLIGGSKQIGHNPNNPNNPSDDSRRVASDLRRVQQVWTHPTHSPFSEMLPVVSPMQKTSTCFVQRTQSHPSLGSSKWANMKAGCEPKTSVQACFVCCSFFALGLLRRRSSSAPCWGHGAWIHGVLHHEHVVKFEYLRSFLTYQYILKASLLHKEDHRRELGTHW
jgi:hypothetical protein